MRRIRVLSLIRRITLFSNQNIHRRCLPMAAAGLATIISVRLTNTWKASSWIQLTGKKKKSRDPRLFLKFSLLLLLLILYFSILESISSTLSQLASFVFTKALRSALATYPVAASFVL